MTLLSDPPPARRVLPIDADRPDFIDLDSGGGSGDGDGNGGPWVTIATFVEPVEAHLARARLEQEEIPAILLDEHTAGTAWHYAQAVGGVKLQVPQARAERAALLLARHGETDDATRHRRLAVPSVDCPRCASTDTAPVRFTSRRMIGLVLLTFVALGVHWLVALGVMAWCIIAMMLSGDRTCRACGYDWFVTRPSGGRGFDVIAPKTPPRLPGQSGRQPPGE